MDSILIAIVYFFGCIFMVRIADDPIWTPVQARVYHILGSLGITTAILLFLVELLHQAGLFGDK